jgi:sugar phosphate isomerase/epimerase
MAYSRRTFLKNSALAAAATGAFPWNTSAAPTKKDIVGLQLYCVRDAMKADPAGSLKKLADMGYVYVEHANYEDRKFYGYSAKDFKVLLDGLGLKMISGHTRFDPDAWDAGKNDFTDTWKYTVEDAAAAGQRFVISPWIDEKVQKDYDGLLKLMDLFNKSGELCKKHGMKFGYHNHWFEFNTVLNNEKMFDIIMQKTDPALVAMQLDMGNLYNGGAIAIAIVMQYPDRFELMHVKDEIPSTNPKAEADEKYESTILGEGIVNTKQVCDTGRKTGTKYFIIEQESYQGKDPFDCCKTDLAIMKKWGY